MSTMTVPPPINVVTTDSDQRNMAALAHASILLNMFLPGLGVIAAGAVWLTQRDRVGFAARQALQATVYQAVLLVLPLVVAIVGAIVLAVVILVGAATDNVMILGLIPLFMLGALAMIFVWLFGMIYALLAAYDAYQGRDFRYAIVGRMLDR